MVTRTAYRPSDYIVKAIGKLEEEVEKGGVDMEEKKKRVEAMRTKLRRTKKERQVEVENPPPSTPYVEPLHITRLFETKKESSYIEEEMTPADEEMEDPEEMMQMLGKRPQNSLTNLPK